jgi:hypothetical protein
MQPVEIIDDLVEERRSARRALTCLKGRVILEGGVALECLVRDYSPKGARIEVEAAATVPDAFRFYFPLLERAFSAHVKWRRDKVIGLVFADA